MLNVSGAVVGQFVVAVVVAQGRFDLPSAEAEANIPLLFPAPAPAPAFSSPPVPFLHYPRIPNFFHFGAHLILHHSRRPRHSSLNEIFLSS